MENRIFPSPNLILSIDGGPKKGETLDCRPGNFIRIGRVVRGNTIAIKDHSISQKHLTFSFQPEISRWSVADYSSNGTIINDVLISPNDSSLLADGDVIKIGESTLISVKISDSNSAPEPQTRRGRRMTAAVTSPEEEVTQGNGSAGSDTFLNNDEAQNQMAEECKTRRSTRASSMACSARILKELEPVMVEGCSKSSNTVVERTSIVSKTKDEEREVLQEKVEKPTKKGRKRRGDVKIGAESTGVLRKDTVLGSVSVKRKMIRVEALNQIVEEGKTRRPTRASAMACSAEVVEENAVLGSVAVKRKMIRVEALKIVEKGQTRRSTRASAMACSARHTKEDEAVEENVEEPTKNPQHRRQARCNKSVVSARALRDDKDLKPVVVEGDCRTKASESSARILKENDEGMEVGQQKVNDPTKNEVKGRGGMKSGVEPAKVLGKDAALGSRAVKRKMGRAVKASSMASSSRVMIMEEQDGEPLEKIEGLVKDGREVMGRAKRGGASARVSRKGEVLEPLVVEGRIGRVTRASTKVMDSSVRVAEEHEEEDKENNEDMVERPAKIGRNQRARGKRGGRSTRISRKDEALESAPMEKKMTGMTMALDVAVSSSSKVSKELQKNHVTTKLDLHSDVLEVAEKNKSILKKIAGGEGEKLAVCKHVKFGFEEVGNDMTNMMSGDPNKTEDMHISNKNELAYSWSSFSEIRGIPNTTSKYREDRLINWHATPFEERVQKALKRGITETCAGEF